MQFKNQSPYCFFIRTGHNRLDLSALVVFAGMDVSITILGGDCPHIGAVAIGQPRPNLENCTSTSASSSVFCLLGHKEDAIAKGTAEYLAAKLGNTVIVTAGMHWDKLKQEEIKIVLSKTETLAGLVFGAILKKRSSSLFSGTGFFSIDAGK